MKFAEPKILLKRGKNQIVDNFLSTLGPLRETSVSASLAYILYLEPDLAFSIFGISDPIISINLEYRDIAQDRYDIVLETTKRVEVIEIKLRHHNKFQIDRYSATKKHLTLIGEKLWPGQYHNTKNFKFIGWKEVVERLQLELRKKKLSLFAKELIKNLISHLRENSIVKADFQDVYVRDLSGHTVELYFNFRIYQCQTQFFETSKNCRFYSPYFTASNDKAGSLSLIPVGVGISYISKILTPFVASEKDAWKILEQHKYPKKHIEHIYERLRWRKSGSKLHAIYLLGDPMRFVQRPITKTDLGIHGAMGSRCFDFETLLKAANGIKR